MQQTFNLKDWFSAARVKGIFRYHLRTSGSVALWLLAIAFFSGLLNVLLPAFFASAQYYWLADITADIATSIFFTLIGAQIMANRSSRFLLRFGTPRFSVWLFNLLSLWGIGAALLLCTLVSSAALASLALWLTKLLPQYGLVNSAFFGGQTSLVFDGAFLNMSISKALSALPGQLLLLMEWSAIFYLFTCCLRRAKWWTLTVIAGLPLMMILLSVIPAARHAADVVASGNQTAISTLGLQWLHWINKAMVFLRKEWPTVQLCIAAASLPLSYLCMRGTKQP